MTAARPCFEQTRVASDTDIDELGHVNNGVYVRWIQEIAVLHWRAVAPPEHVDSVVWVVTRHEIDYLRPSHAGETLSLRTWVGEPRGARFDRYVEVRGADGALRVSAVTTWALLDRARRRPMRVTQQIAGPFLA